MRKQYRERLEALEHVQTTVTFVPSSPQEIIVRVVVEDGRPNFSGHGAVAPPLGSGGSNQLNAMGTTEAVNRRVVAL